MRKYFGTDGVRGVAGAELTGELAFKTGAGAGAALRVNDSRPRVLIARDTRVSGQMLESALAAGLCASGCDVLLAGVVPTPAAGYLAGLYGCDAGAVISASHNPYYDNGIKFCRGDGSKYSESEEELIERYIESPPSEVTGAEMGRISVLSDAAEKYASHIIAEAPMPLTGMRVMIDCSNGAAAETARRIFPALGCVCEIVCDLPDGVNINEKCGSTHMDALCAMVKAGKYDLGIAFDGDADRCLACDENGELVDGDVIIGILAEYLSKKGEFRGGAVGTVMSNMGLKAFLKERGMEYRETQVGDKYVYEALRESGFNLGGEQSGHIILTDHASMGDGQLTAVFLMAALRESGLRASALRKKVALFPQVTVNIDVPNDKKRLIADCPEVKKMIASVTDALAGEGRILVRPSGTEPKVRLMLEGRDISLIERLSEKAAEVIRDSI